MPFGSNFLTLLTFSHVRTNRDESSECPGHRASSQRAEETRAFEPRPREPPEKLLPASRAVALPVLAWWITMMAALGEEEETARRRALRVRRTSSLSFSLPSIMLPQGSNTITSG